MARCRVSGGACYGLVCGAGSGLVVVESSLTFPLKTDIRDLAGKRESY